MKTIMKQDFLNLLKNKPIMLYLILYPPVLILVAGFVFQQLFNQDILSSYDYYGVTMLVFLTTATVIILPELLFGSQVKYANFRIIYSPISREKMYLSKIIVALLVPYVLFSAYILVFNYFGRVNYGGKQVGNVIFIEFFLLLFAITFGGAFCVLVKNEDLTTKILNLVVNVLAAISGVFFPIYIFGKKIAKISEYSPISMVINTIYKGIYDNDFTSMMPTMVVLVGCSILFILLIHLNYQPETYGKE